MHSEALDYSVQINRITLKLYKIYNVMLHFCHSI